MVLGTAARSCPESRAALASPTAGRSASPTSIGHLDSLRRPTSQTGEASTRSRSSPASGPALIELGTVTPLVAPNAARTSGDRDADRELRGLCRTTPSSTEISHDRRRAVRARRPSIRRHQVAHLQSARDATGSPIDVDVLSTAFDGDARRQQQAASRPTHARFRARPLTTCVFPRVSASAHRPLRRRLDDLERTSERWHQAPTTCLRCASRAPR